MKFISSELRVGVGVHFNLLRKLLYSYLQTRRSFSFNLFQSFHESYHHVSQRFLHEMIQGQSDAVDAQLGLKILLERSVF